MPLRPHPVPPVPQATAAAVQAACPSGHRYVARRTAVGPRSNAQLLAALEPSAGRPVAGAPWRLARVMSRPSLEGRPERQAADAVRRGLEWKEARRLERPGPGCDCPLRHEFRHRALAHEAGRRGLEPCLAAGNARGWLKARGTPRPEAPPVPAAIRTRPRREGVLGARPWALDPRRGVAPTWGPPPGPPAWSPRDGRRSDQARVPKAASTREALARPVGAEGRQRREGAGDALQAFGLEWEAPQARCPQGPASVRWRPGHEGSGAPVMRRRCDGGPGRACPARRACTSAPDAPRQRTVRRQADHEARQAARHRQKTPAVKAPYPLRAGVARRRSPGARCFAPRRSRSLGVARTPRQQRLTAPAMEVVRSRAGLGGQP
jgi:Transposase DDE domain